MFYSILSTSLLTENRKQHRTPPLRGRGTEAVRTTGATGQDQTLVPRRLHFRLLQRSLPPTGAQPTSPRAPKVAASRNHGVARGNKMRIFPKSCPRTGAVPVRRREETVCGDAAITQESRRSPGSPCPPLSSPAAGGRHLPSPPPWERSRFRCVTSGGRDAEGKDCD